MKLERFSLDNLKPSCQWWSKTQYCRSDVHGSYVNLKIMFEFPDKSLPTILIVVMWRTFEIMRKFQKLLSRCCLPQHLSQQSGKDKLFNDVLNLLEMKTWDWAPDEVESERVFLTTLTVFLRHLGSHHDTLCISPGIRGSWIVLTIFGVRCTPSVKVLNLPYSKFSYGRLASYSASWYEVILSSWISPSRWTVMKKEV